MPDKQNPHFMGRAASFDLTHYGETGWDCMKRIFKLQYVGRGPSNQFVFMAKNGLIIETRNNPETGEYHAGPSHRENDPGFACYIGVYGSPARVERFIRATLAFADYVKQVDPIGRSFA